MTGKKQQKIKDILSNKKLREHNSYVEVLGSQNQRKTGNSQRQRERGQAQE